jgi:uncharacterized protein
MKIRRAPRTIALGAIAIYRAAISPMLHAMNGPACRFEPSCSEYGRDAIAEYGIIRGGAMALWRIARCNPMGGHGYDPVRGRTSRGEFGMMTLTRRFEDEASASPCQGEAIHVRIMDKD